MSKRGKQKQIKQTKKKKGTKATLLGKKGFTTSAKATHLAMEPQESFGRSEQKEVFTSFSHRMQVVIFWRLQTDCRHLAVLLLCYCKEM